MGNEQHPAWGVYDKLRSARLNVKYYSARLQYFERLHFWSELIIVAAAPSSAITGLLFWKTEIGNSLWQVLASIAAIAAVARQPMQLTRNIKEVESLLSAYRLLEFDLKELKLQIEQRRRYDRPMAAELQRITHRERALIAKNPEARENRKLLARCTQEVLGELPVESFVIPPEASI